MVERWTFWALLIACVFVSIGGIFLAVVYNSPTDGGRGGAVAVTIALFAFAFSRDYGTSVYNLLRTNSNLRILLTETEEDPRFDTTEIRIKSIEDEVNALEAKLRIEAEGQKSLNLFIAFSAAIGTITWGFGDWVAFYIITKF